MDVNTEKLDDQVEDLRDLVEFLSEIYENCSQNRTVIRLLTNTLLHYCYLPVIIPALVGSMKGFNGANISISTALYFMTLTFKEIKS